MITTVFITSSNLRVASFVVGVRCGQPVVMLSSALEWVHIFPFGCGSTTYIGAFIVHYFYCVRLCHLRNDYVRQ